MKNHQCLTDRTEMERYVELTTWIRELSAPEVTDDTGPEDYRKKLMGNFTRIGELARINGGILERNIYPLLEGDGLLAEADADNLHVFNDALLDATHLENLDTPLMFLDAERLLKHADALKDDNRLVHALLDVMTSAYTMLFMAVRLYPCADLCFRYRDIGLEAAGRILEYLPRERFVTLSDQGAREKVLIASRYIFAMFSRQDSFGDDRVNESDFDTLFRSLQLADDPFYRKEVPDYDWDSHRFRVMQYICDLTERNNERGFHETLLKRIADIADEMDALWRSDETKFGALAPPEVMELLLLRTGYLAGRTSLKEYRTRLLGLMNKRNKRDFSYQSILINVSAPIEYMLTFRDGEPGQAEQIHISSFYRSLIGYIHHMPKRGAITFLLTDLSDILKHFIPIEGAVGFEELCLTLLAALHPPTFVHSLNVSDLAVCLTRHLVRRNPESFIGFAGCKTEADVRAKEQELTEAARHAGRLHDVGKLFIIETIITYGRPLFEAEFEWIRTHPAIGAYLLSLYPETALYAGAAGFHHKWYNDEDGYPADACLKARDDRTLVNVIGFADCLDAATDTIGRSYKPGKTLEEFIEEVREDGGKRFSPHLLALLEDEDVRTDLSSILTYGRDENYRNAYRLMRGV